MSQRFHEVWNILRQICHSGKENPVAGGGKAIEFFRIVNMPAKRKVNLQPNDSTKAADARKGSDSEASSIRQKRFKQADAEDDVVDYGEERTEHTSQPAAPSEAQPNAERTVQLSPEEEERVKITKALESWCNNNIAKEKDDPDVADRVAALAEVGLLLVFDLEKYNSADSMRSELEDIGSIIGGELVVTRYINFILSLQNQLKKTRAIAERQHRQHHMMQQMPFPGAHFHPMGGHVPHVMMPMMGHPGGPMFMPGHHPMYTGNPAFAGPGHAPARGNMTLNTTGEMTAIEKQREKERKRKDILRECTDHLKALLERSTKSTDQAEKAKIFELIDKVKKRIESLKEVTPQPAHPKAQPAKGANRGYYGNQYINPKLLEQTQTESAQNPEQ
jgi:hypothetical protein